MQNKPLLRLVARIDKPLREGVPVSTAVPEGDLPDGPVTLVEVKGAERVPIACQVERGAECRVHWLAGVGSEAAGEHAYELLAGEPPRFAVVEARREEGSMLVVHDGASVLRYHHEPMPPPEGADPLYVRSAFIHPIWSPAGEVVTRIHPPDHIHHMGLWNPWTSTEFEGRHVDFWNLKAGQGTVRFAEYAASSDGAVYGGFTAVQEHVDLEAAGGEKIALREHWSVRVWHWGGYDAGCFLVDLVSTYRCASTSPLQLNAYRYGGLGFRAREDWDKGDYLTSEGKTRKDGHATRSRWCHTYGPTAKGPAGVLFMSHPDNREHPEPMRIWPKPPQIFFNYCPIQKKAWTLEPGREYVLRYRLYIYNGPPSVERAEQLWQAFAHPPKISVEALGK